MPTITAMRTAAVSLVESTDLALGPIVNVPSASDEPRGGSEEAYVNAGSLVAFDPGVSPENRKDVLNSTLFAQRAADRQHKREEEPDSWYSVYTRVLGTIGWRLDGFQFARFESRTNEFTVKEVVTSVITAIADSSGIQRVTRAIEALAALGDADGRIQLLNQNSRSQARGAFQVGTARQANGVVTMGLGTFYFAHDANVKNLLVFSFGKDSTAFYAGAQQATLNDDVYSTVRATVIEKLTAHLPHSIARIEI